MTDVVWLLIAAAVVVVAAAPGLAALALFVRSLSRRVGDLESLRLLDAAERGKLQCRVDELEHGVNLLIAQIRRLGATPEWMPTPQAGATLSGRRLDLETGQAVALDGALTLVEPEAGTFDWRYVARAVAAAGAYQVQFVATFDDGLTDRTLAELWIVEPAL